MKLESSQAKLRTNEKFSDNPGHNILKLYYDLVQAQFAISKTKRDLHISWTKHVLILDKIFEINFFKKSLKSIIKTNFSTYQDKFLHLFASQLL